MLEEIIKENIRQRKKVMALQREVRKLKKGMSSQKCRDDNYALVVRLGKVEQELKEKSCSVCHMEIRHKMDCPKRRDPGEVLQYYV
jgi:hypothetical protein